MLSAQLARSPQRSSDRARGRSSASPLRGDAKLASAGDKGALNGNGHKRSKVRGAEGGAPGGGIHDAVRRLCVRIEKDGFAAPFQQSHNARLEGGLDPAAHPTSMPFLVW